MNFSCFIQYCPKQVSFCLQIFAYFPQCLAAEFSHEGVQSRLCCSPSHRLHRYDQRLRRGRLPEGQGMWTVIMWHFSRCKHRTEQSSELVLPPAPLVWVSGSQSRLCRPSWIREADHPERSLEGGHQSAQPSGTVRTRPLFLIDGNCSGVDAVFVCVFFRITSTVPKSGWNLPADTSRWA